MNFSFSTLLMAFLVSNILVVFIALCFRRQKILMSVGYKVLVVFLFLTILRFIFPIELPVATTVQMPGFLSPLVTFLRHPFFRPLGLRVSPWFVFGIVWAIGSLHYLRLYIKDCIDMRGLVTGAIKEVTHEEPYASLLAEICGRRRNRFRVLISGSIETPCLYGIMKPYILIPKDMPLTREELYYVLHHEVTHHKYHDLLTKRVVRIMYIIYWWNPACRMLRKQVELLLEMRIDGTLIKKNQDVAQEYMMTLFHVADLAIDNKYQLPAGDKVSMAGKGSSALSQRVEMMLHERKVTNVLLAAALCILIAMVYIGSYTFTFESRYASRSNTAGTFDAPDRIYAVPKEDGTYDIFFYGEFTENVESLDGYPADIQIQQ